MLKVSKQANGHPEIFHSLQGEGVNIGRPAVFLRLSLCNLSCNWCDTKYTWDWQKYDPKEQIIEMSLNEVEQEILKYDCRFLVVTGGEPMIQQQNLIPLLECLKKRGFQIELETNATIMPMPEFPNLVDSWSISPKLDNSGNKISSREVPQVYDYFKSLPSAYFKYVIQNEVDLVEVEDIRSKYNLPPKRIILMPEAQDQDVLLRRSSWLAEQCRNRGYLFSFRLQVLLWGNKRGM